MKNIIAYYYDLHPDILDKKDDNYTFIYKDKKYVFFMLKRPINEINYINDTVNELIKNNIMFHEILINKENNVVTFVYSNAYILMEININDKTPVTLPEICYINNNSIKIKCNDLILRTNWAALWEAKNDFLESQINEIGKKYSDLFTYANYYIGLCENAIMYVKNIDKLSDSLAYSCVSHKRIRYNDTLLSLYNPLNIICDYRVRDVCEYIKDAFFNEKDALNLLHEYFKNNYLTYKEALLFYARLLYPSYFFDITERVINNDVDEKEIEKILSKSGEYEKFLIYVNYFLTNMYSMYVPQLDWLIKRS